MKRLLVFVVLGPLIGGAVLSVIYDDATGLGWFAAFPFGVLLAFLTAVLDYALKHDRWQLPYVALSGYLLTALVFHSWLSGIAGCAAAGLCSWLANQSWRTSDV
jgi:hypothetical protein